MQVQRTSEKRKSKSPHIIIVIPTLNEERGISHTIAKLNDAFRGVRHSIVVVDGGSKDSTVSVAKGGGAIVIPQRYQGYGDALSTGFHYGLYYLKGNIFLTTDGDGTYDAYDARSLTDHVQHGDVDYGIGRRVDKGESLSFLRKYGNDLISWITCRLLRLQVKDTQSGMMAFQSYLVENVDLLTTGWGINTEMLKLARELDLRIGEYPVKYYRRIGESKLNPLHAGIVDVAIALRLMRDTEPLLMFGLIGGILVLSGVAFGAIAVVGWVQRGVFPLASTIASVLTLVVGVQLISLGLVAEMLKTRLRRRRYVSPKLFEKYE